MIAMALHVEAQIVLNEICPSNANVIGDEDGEYPDWIELYNAGASAVNLQGYALSDKGSDLTKWTFPNVSIDPSSHLTVFASGKDRKNTVDHWETVVKDSYTWRYLVPTAPVPPDWNTLGFNDGAWSIGVGGFGYGDGDDGTVISSPQTSVFMRYEFNIVDTSVIGDIYFHMDYDDGFVAYLNGVEIMRENVGVNGQPAAYNTFAYDQHEALLYQGQLPEEYKFVEEDVKTVLTNGLNVICIQVHNNTNTSSDMSARPFVTLGIKDASNSYDNVPTWFKAGEAWMHTNFTIKSGGENVYLVDNGANIIDQIASPDMQSDDSYGRFPDGNANLAYFGIPTPDSTNNSSASYAGYVSPPDFSIDGGFYSASQTLALSDTFPGAIVRYTIDGTAANVASPQYSSAIQIDANMVVRAAGFSVGYLPSEISTNTYFIDDYSTLPVMSISTAPEKLFDWNTGIYTLGPNAQPNVPYYGANYWQDWEIPIHMEYFDVNENLQFEQGLGMKIHGGWSRTQPQKSFRLLAKGRYGEPSLDYQLFPDKEIYSFKRFILRTSGNETAQSGTFFRDALMHKLVEDTHNDYQDYAPVVTYLNGQFWGIYNMREKIGRYYLAENYGVDPDSVDLLQFDGAVIEGSNDDFIDLATVIITQNMADTTNYQAVEARLDIPNFCDHFITQTFYVNWDWPQNNIKYWRAQQPGWKWRYIVTDMDFGLGMGGSVNDNDIERVLTQSNTGHAFMLNALLNNTTFHDYFINRYADLINTIFTAKNMRNLAYAYRDSIMGDMPDHLNLWGGDMNTWQLVNIEGNLVSFLNNRQGPARDHIEQYFNLNKQVDVTLNVYPEGAGTIRISTIVPDSLPWTGVYFDGVPVTITANPNPGFQFSFWQSINLVPAPNTNASITMNIDTNDAFTAYFLGSPDTPRVTISEINYKSEQNFDVGDWVELHNYGAVDMDLSGWVFKDANDANIYTIPDSTIINTDGYLVIVEDLVQFAAGHPGVSNHIGPFNFGLSSNTDMIRLFDEKGDLYLSMTYYGASPWPELANGQGRSLELLDPYNNLSSSSNWFEGCFGGSPGVGFTPCVIGIDAVENGLKGLIVENYPNPFDQNANIFITTAKQGLVRVRIVDLLGNQVAVLHAGQLPAGRHYMNYKPEGLSSGIYYLHVQTSNQSQVKVLSYLKQE